MPVQSNEFINILKSRTDHTPIKLSTSGCSKIIFEEIALIQLDYQNYFILKPVTVIQGCEGNKAMVLYLNVCQYEFVKDEKIIMEVFKIYYDMILNDVECKQGSFIKSKTIVESANIDTNSLYRNTMIKMGLKKVKKYEATFSDVIGQNNIIEGVIEYLYSELDKPKHGPRGSMVFLGPPGTGKTMLAKKIGKALGLPTKLFSMASFSDKEANFDFAGIHKTYKAAREGVFTGFINNNPRCVVILDEFEKAHEVIIRLFLNALEEGRIRDAFLEKEISLSETIIIFTSNVCKNIYDRDFSKYNYANISKKEIIEEMSKEVNPVTNSPFFSSAIVSRFSMSPIFMFNRLSPISAHKIVEAEINKEKEYYERNKKISIDIDTNSLANFLIYQEGDTNDLRSLKRKVSSFFDNFFNNLDQSFGKLYPDQSYSLINSNFNFVSNNEDVNRIIKDINNNTYEYQVLFITNNKDDKLLKTITKKYKNINIFVGDENFNFLNTYNLGLNAIILDVSDNSTLIKKGFDELIVREFDVPIYIYNSEKVSKAMFKYYINKGCEGYYSPLINTNLNNWTENIFNSLKLTTILNRLKSQCRSLDIDFGYEYIDSKVNIVCANIDIRTSISCDDNKYFTPRSEMDSIHFNDIFGCEKASNDIKECLNALKNYQTYRKENLKIPKGIIMYGPPGTGKTLRAKAIAIDANLPFISLCSTDFMKSVVGEGVTMVHNVFSSLRKYGGILFIDEFELIGKNRDEAGARSDYHEITNAFLAEMDGFNSKSKKPILVVAATNFDASNSSQTLDKAVLRRFDYKIKIDNPNKEERKAYITKMLEKKKIKEISEKAIDNIAIRTIDWNYADIYKIINTFAIKLYDLTHTNSFNKIDMDDYFNEVFESIDNGESKTLSIDELKRIAYHEAGHALVSYKLNKTPDYITIVSRGNYGGYVFNSYEGKFDFNKQEMLDNICISLAGRASETLVYGDKGITTGSSSDIKAANMKAKLMYTDYGMLSDDLYSFDNEEIDDNGKTIIKETLKNELLRAKSILINNRTILDTISNELINKNFLIKNDFLSLVEGVENARSIK